MQTVLSEDPFFVVGQDSEHRQLSVLNAVMTHLLEVLIQVVSNPHVVLVHIVAPVYHLLDLYYENSLVFLSSLIIGYHLQIRSNLLVELLNLILAIYSEALVFESLHQD